MTRLPHREREMNDRCCFSHVAHNYVRNRPTIKVFWTWQQLGLLGTVKEIVKDMRCVLYKAIIKYAIIEIGVKQIG